MLNQNDRMNERKTVSGLAVPVTHNLTMSESAQKGAPR